MQTVRAPQGAGVILRAEGYAMESPPLERVYRAVCTLCEDRGALGTHRYHAEWNARDKGWKLLEGRWYCPVCLPAAKEALQRGVLPAGEAVGHD